MKKYIKTLVILSFMFVSTIAIAFPGNIDGGPSGDNDPPAPIDAYVIGLLAIGIGFAFWKYSKKTTKA